MAAPEPQSVLPTEERERWKARRKVAVGAAGAVVMAGVARACACRATFAYESSTPFGKPVVPEV